MQALKFYFIMGLHFYMVWCTLHCILLLQIIITFRFEFGDQEELTEEKVPEEISTPDTHVKSSLFDSTAQKLDPMELQSCLNELTLGPLLQSKVPTPKLFEPRIYQTTNQPEFISSPSNAFSFDEGLDRNWGPRRRKPVLSPARLQLNNLTHSSWVAGGYWQQNAFPSPPSLYNPFPFSNFPLSRSSSQSSGFASQGGTNYSSLPNSRTGSVCEADRFSVMSEPMYPSYSPPPAPYCCYVATPHPATFFLSPIPSSPSPRSSITPPETYASETEKISRCPTPGFNNTATRQKSLLALVKENFFLATLFFSSIVFNIMVIAFAAVNTFQVH